MVKIGSVNAGYTIIEGISTKNINIVIGRKSDKDFVCWMHTEHGGYFWGYYTDSFAAARQKMLSRYKNEIEE